MLAKDQRLSRLGTLLARAQSRGYAPGLSTGAIPEAEASKPAISTTLVSGTRPAAGARPISAATSVSGAQMSRPTPVSVTAVSHLGTSAAQAPAAKLQAPVLAAQRPAVPSAVGQFEAKPKLAVPVVTRPKPTSKPVEPEREVIDADAIAMSEPPPDVQTAVQTIGQADASPMLAAPGVAKGAPSSAPPAIARMFEENDDDATMVGSSLRVPDTAPESGRVEAGATEDAEFAVRAAAAAAIEPVMLKTELPAETEVANFAGLSPVASSAESFSELIDDALSF